MNTHCPIHGESHPQRHIARLVLVDPLAALPTKLLEVALFDGLERRLELGLVDAHHDKNAKVERIQVGIGEQTLW